MRKKWSLRASIFVALFAAGGAAWGEPSAINPIDLIERSDIVLVIQLPEGTVPGELCKARVLGRVKGFSPDEVTVTFRYPKQIIGELFIKPEKDLRLVAFLRKANGDEWVPTSAVYAIERIVGQKEVSEAKVGPGGGSSFLSIGSADVKGTEDILKGFLNWKRSSKAEREKAIIAAIASGGAVRVVGMEVLLAYKNFDWEDPGCVSDAILEGVLTCLKDKQCKIRAVGLLSMSVHIRKDMVPYLVDLLDDPECSPAAIVRLDGRNGFGPGPALEASLTTQEKVLRLKRWWSEDGSKNLKYMRFVPKVNSDPSKTAPEEKASNDEDAKDEMKPQPIE